MTSIENLTVARDLKRLWREGASERSQTAPRTWKSQPFRLRHSPPLKAVAVSDVGLHLEGPTRPSLHPEPNVGGLHLSRDPQPILSPTEGRVGRDLSLRARGYG